jgi:large subunit ribosomal protein L7/L12
MADLKKFAEELVNLSVKEVNELAKILKEEYGIEPAAAAAGSIPYSSFSIFASSFTSLTDKLTSSSANFLRSAIFIDFKLIIL